MILPEPLVSPPGSSALTPPGWQDLVMMTPPSPPAPAPSPYFPPGPPQAAAGVGVP